MGTKNNKMRLLPFWMQYCNGARLRARFYVTQCTQIHTLACAIHNTAETCRRGGRDHIWFMTHDEGACYAPTGRSKGAFIVTVAEKIDPRCVVKSWLAMGLYLDECVLCYCRPLALAAAIGAYNAGTCLGTRVNTVQRSTMSASC